MKKEIIYYTKGLALTGLASALAGPALMYLAMPSPGGIDPRTGDIAIDPQPDTMAIPVAVVLCYIVYGFIQFWRHRPEHRVFSGVRYLGLFWAVTLLPLAFAGLWDVLAPPSTAGPFNNRIFEFAGLAVFLPLLILELLAVGVFLLMGGGKPARNVRRIPAGLARQINENLRGKDGAE